MGAQANDTTVSLLIIKNNIKLLRLIDFRKITYNNRELLLSYQKLGGKNECIKYYSPIHRGYRFIKILSYYTLNPKILIYLLQRETLKKLIDPIFDFTDNPLDQAIIKSHLIRVEDFIDRFPVTLPIDYKFTTVISGEILQLVYQKKGIKFQNIIELPDINQNHSKVRSFT